MNLEFKTNKLKKQCENPGEAQKIYGKQIGTKLTQRTNELIAAKNLHDVSLNKANGFHKLDGDRNDEFAVWLVHPFRLIFRAICDDDILELESIDEVRIEEVIDYHGKNKRK